MSEVIHAPLTNHETLCELAITDGVLCATQTWQEVTCAKCLRIIADVKAGLADAMAGNTHPVSELWDNMEDDTL